MMSRRDASVEHLQNRPRGPRRPPSCSPETLKKNRPAIKKNRPSVHRAKAALGVLVVHERVQHRKDGRPFVCCADLFFLDYFLRGPFFSGLFSMPRRMPTANAEDPCRFRRCKKTRLAATFSDAALRLDLYIAPTALL